MTIKAGSTVGILGATGSGKSTLMYLLERLYDLPDTCGRITIGDHVMLGPKVALYAVNHPMDPTVRDTGLEYGCPITIGSHVWIGGSTTVCPGVTIGSNVVIGAGSVVVGNIPDNVVAAGNPARVIRPVTEADKTYWTKMLEQYQELAEK